MPSSSRMRIKLRGFDVGLLDQSTKAIVEAVKKGGSQVIGPVPLPVKTERYTVLRSPHVDKKSREQFERRTYKRVIDIPNPSSSVMDELMRLELSAGVDVVIKQ